MSSKRLASMASVTTAKRMRAALSRSPLIGAGLACAILLGGCASRTLYSEVAVSEDQISKARHGRDPDLHPLLDQMLKQGHRNETFNAMRLGLAAMERGDDRTAVEMLELAVGGIERVFADEEEARRITKKEYGEGAKPFKGESYERAMAYYYLGVMRLKAGKYDGAGACFRAGLTQDVWAEDKQFKTDFALMPLLEGWSLQCDGQHAEAAQAYSRASSMRSGRLQRPSATDNTLIIIETGTSPRKLSDGLGHHKLKFFRGRNFTEEAARVTIAGRSLTVTPVEDIYWQSRTRGAREIDYILADKGAMLKTATDSGSGLASAGNNVSLVGSAFGGPVAGIGGGIALAGMLSLASEMNSNPRADTRYWDNLPDKVHVLTTQARIGDNVEVQFLDSDGRGVMNASGTVQKAGNFGIVWIRSRPSVIHEMVRRDFENNLGQ